MEDLAVNQTTDPIVGVKENRVVVFGHQLKRYPAHFVCFFVKSLFSVIVCPKTCENPHPRFGLHLPSNQVVVFEGCDKEQGYYTPYLNEKITPFRMPDVGDPVIMGIKWASKRVPKKKEVVEGCLLDHLLVDLKVRTLAQKVCLNCLFRHKSGPGFFLEQILRTLIAHVLVFAQPLGKSKFDRIAVFTAEEELRIRRVWFDKNCLFLKTDQDQSGKTVEAIHYCAQGNVFHLREGYKEYCSCFSLNANSFFLYRKWPLS